MAEKNIKVGYTQYDINFNFKKEIHTIKPFNTRSTGMDTTTEAREAFTVRVAVEGVDEDTKW